MPRHHHASTNSPDTSLQTITDPDTIVDGRTLLQWIEKDTRWSFGHPAGTPTANPFADPTGQYAEQYNHGPVFFLTGVGHHYDNSHPRTIDVPEGKPILLPIINIEDTEGPNIPPTIQGFTGSFQDEVNEVLNTVQFSNVATSIDGQPVTNLQEIKTGIFNAGPVKPESFAQALFGLPGTPGAPPPGTQLNPSGDAGYWVVIEGLSPGLHTLSSTWQFSSPIYGTHSATTIENINIVPPGHST